MTQLRRFICSEQIPPSKIGSILDEGDYISSAPACASPIAAVRPGRYIRMRQRRRRRRLKREGSGRIRVITLPGIPQASFCKKRENV